MTDFLREWAKHYRIRFIIALILCVFFVYSIIAVQTSDSPWGMIIIAFMLSTIIWDRLREFNSSFEGLLVDKYYERVGKGSRDYYFKFSKDGREFIRKVDLEQYGVVEIGDYIKKEPKTFGLQSSFEGLLVDKYDVRTGKGGKNYYFKFSKGGREFIRQIELKQYEIAEIGDYINRFGWQITPASDSTDNT